MSPVNIPNLPIKPDDDLSPLQKARIGYEPQIPAILRDGSAVLVEDKTFKAANADKVAALFPHTHSTGLYDLAKPQPGQPGLPPTSSPLNVGVLFSGGQAPGGHNVAAGIFDYLNEFHPGSVLYGIQNGPAGLIKGNAFIVTEAAVRPYRNQGGFDMLGSSRTKIEKSEDFEAALATVKRFGLNVVVIVGGDDSNTNAAHLAEYFKRVGEACHVIGVPKTIDGDLKCAHIPMSFGFDSATKLYSELIGNVMTDSRSAVKYWHFIRLMGRSASHITLECALQTRPNWAWIGEEVQAKKMSLNQIAAKTADIVAARSAKGLDYGVLLVPEGLIEFVPEIGALISELNSLMAGAALTEAEVAARLSEGSRRVFESIPDAIRAQLLMDRDPHGNVQVAKIETEKLLALMVEHELSARRARGEYKGAFNYVAHYFGYEGRCCLPSNVDANYCYALGRGAVALASRGATGVIVSITNLHAAASEWKVHAAPLVGLMTIEVRKGKPTPVIEKALVILEGPVQRALEAVRDTWALEDRYRSPGPTQLFGPLADEVNLTLAIEYGGK